MNLQVKLLAGAAALLLSSGAFAQGGGQDDLHAIAKASGLHVRQVQMLLGYASGQIFSHNYEQAERKLRRAVQEGRVQLQLPEWVSAEQAARPGAPARAPATTLIAVAKAGQ